MRLAAVALDLAYREGKPVEGAQVLNAKAEHFSEKLSRLNQYEVYRDKFSQEKIAELHKSGKPHRSRHRTKYYKLAGSRCAWGGPDAE